MKFRLGIGLCCMALMISLAGCQLALEESGANQREFVGVFVTTAHIEELVSRYQNQGEDDIGWTVVEYLPGRIAEDDRFEFGIPGFSLFIENSMQESEFIPQGTSLRYVDEAIGEIQLSVHLDAADGSESISTRIEGSLYLVPELLLNTNDESLGLNVFYMHPVYRNKDGNIYLEPSGFGMGIAFVDWNFETGRDRRYSMRFEESFTRTVGGREETNTISVTLYMIPMHSPEALVIYQMSEEGELLSRTEFAPDEMPEDFVPDEETEFMVVETWSREGENAFVASRSVYGREAEEIESFRAREDGVNVIQRSNIDW